VWRRIIWCFGGTYCLHLQSWKLSQASSHQKWECKQSSTLTNCLLGLHFDLEDGGNTFLWNVGEIPGYMASHPTRRYSSRKNIHQETEKHDLILWTKQLPQKLTVVKLIKNFNILWKFNFHLISCWAGWLHFTLFNYDQFLAYFLYFPNYNRLMSSGAGISQSV
jgi:hypothetical protein